MKHENDDDGFDKAGPKLAIRFSIFMLVVATIGAFMIYWQE